MLEENLSDQSTKTFIGILKDQTDLVNLRKACEISAAAHVAAMKRTKPGMTERQVQAIMVEEFYRQGSAREGYSFIVASGNSATTLHYNFNDQVCEDGVSFVPWRT